MDELIISVNSNDPIGAMKRLVGRDSHVNTPSLIWRYLPGKGTDHHSENDADGT